MEMHDKIFHFEIFQQFHEFYKLFQDPFSSNIFLYFSLSSKLKLFETRLKYMKLVGYK